MIGCQYLGGFCRISPAHKSKLLFSGDGGAIMTLVILDLRAGSCKRGFVEMLVAHIRADGMLQALSPSPRK
jgi:hypothetical protein